MLAVGHVSDEGELLDACREDHLAYVPAAALAILRLRVRIGVHRLHRGEQQRLVVATGATEELALQANDEIQGALRQLQTEGGLVGFRSLAPMLPSAKTQAAVGGAISRAELDGEAPYAPGTDSYDPAAADAFFRARPLLVAKRLCSLSYLTGGFTAGVLWDWLVLGKLLRDEEYKALKASEPRCELARKSGIDQASQDHASDIGGKGMPVDTIGSDGSDPSERLGRYGVWYEAQGETLTNRALTAETMVRQLLVGDQRQRDLAAPAEAHVEEARRTGRRGKRHPHARTWQAAACVDSTAPIRRRAR